MTKRTAIYARVSTDDQRDNYSIPTQIAACLQYAKSRGHMVVGDRFVDPKTGLDVAATSEPATRAYVDDYTSRELSRPVLDAALKYLENHGFDVLVVHALDRLARDPYIRQTLEMEFEKRGAKVEYVLGNYDDTPEGEVRKDIDATFAKWENAKRVERCNRGKKRKAETGLFVAGRAPYGYAIDRDAFGGLAVVEEQAAVVRRIFWMHVVEVRSIHEIRRILTTEGVPPALGGEEWGNSSIRRILTNTVYLGRGFYNKHKKNGKRLEQKDREEWIEFETTPIVEPWLFDEAQRRLALNKMAMRQQPTRFYLLSGIVFCAACKRPYLAQTALPGRNRRKNEAQSYRHRVSHGHCCNHQISARVLEPIVWQEIKGVLMEPERLRQGYEDSLEQQEETTARQKAHLETLRRRMVSVEQMQRNLMTAYVDPDIKMTKTEYLKQKAQVDAEFSELAEKIEKEEADLASIPTPADLETLQTFVTNMKGMIVDGDRVPPEEKRRILEMLHIRVIISKQDKELKIEGWFGPPIEGLKYQTSSCCASRPRPLRAPA